MVKPQESSGSTKDEEYGYTEVRGGSIVYDEPGYIKCEGEIVLSFLLLLLLCLI
jgi:hypothetical protein